MNPIIIETYKDRKGLWRWRMTRSGRIVADSGEGYSRKDKAMKTLRSTWKAFRDGAVKFLALLFVSSAMAINSPRPSSFHADNGRLILVWTNISEAHPWLLSYRLDMNQPWQWDTTRLHATNRSLSVAVPMTNNQGFMRLWPAAPDQ